MPLQSTLLGGAATSGPTRRNLLLGSLLLPALALVDSFVPRVRFRKFLLVSVDTLRFAHVGCFGSPLPTTPALDALAFESTRFTKAFSACSFTMPSITALLTSKMPGMGEHLLANGWTMPTLTTPALAQSFARAGFETAAFVGNYTLRKDAGLTPGFATYDDDFDSLEATRGVPERRCESLTNAASGWLESNWSKSFFLWLHYQDPHGPYTPRPPYDTVFVGQEGPLEEIPLLENQSGQGGLPEYQRLGDHRDLSYYKSQFDGEIAGWDAQFSRLIATLKKLGIYDETVIVVCADHGEAFGERGFYCCHGHGLGPELTRVPLILYVPGSARAVVGAPVSLLDVAPTMLSLARLPVPVDFAGFNLLKAARGSQRPQPVLMETSFAVGAVADSFVFTWGALRTPSGCPENMKISDPTRCGFASGAMELYDLASDPLGSVDVKARNAERFRYMEGICREYLSASTAVYRAHETVSLDETTKSRLRALGYLN